MRKVRLIDGLGVMMMYRSSIPTQPFVYELLLFSLSEGFHSRSLSCCLNSKRTHNTSISSPYTENEMPPSICTKVDTDKWIFLEIQSTRDSDQSNENRLCKQLFMICLKQTLMGRDLKGKRFERFSCFGFVGRMEQKKMNEKRSVVSATSRSE